MVATGTPENQDSPELQRRIHELLTHETFVNARVGVIGLVATMNVYFLMLMFDAGIWDYIRPGSSRPWLDALEIPRIAISLKFFAINWIASICSFTFYFLGERMIRKISHRVMGLNLVNFFTIATNGVMIEQQVFNIEDAFIKLITFCMLVAVASVAGMVFSTNRFMYAIFIVGWFAPAIGHLLFISPEPAAKALGALGIILAAAVTFLSYIEYKRRVLLIRTELNLEKEKAEAVKNFELMRELKHQQDGDYYLTSLLLKPLAVNTTDRDSNIQVEQLTSQKKQFEFKSRSHHIGGDISIAHTIPLKSGDCTVFLNADAMGKSIQGAGGALVLGAVFQSVIARSRLKSETREMYPERWLKYTFMELQTVFESFDCSMLVSMLLAVVENRTGTLFYMNAEHPYGVLLRGDEAAFLDSQSYYRKLGTPSDLNSVRVDTLQLKEGDIIVLGSDGRDDLMISVSDTGERIINEDETRFLERVREAGGNLEKVYDLTRQAGEITDDFSLLKVVVRSIPDKSPDVKVARRETLGLFRGAWQAYREQDTGTARELILQLRDMTEIHPTMLDRLVKISINLKEYELAMHFADALLRTEAANPKSLLLASIAYKRSRRFSEAADLAERLRLRDPKNTDNLINLAEIYLQINPDRAKYIIEGLRKLVPDDARVRNLQTILTT